ncbi:alpha/beta hydrolase [Dietzia sp.]|uniref:alpha/beta hydrolase n=1 Tax=Dietzia sp. TaxID=1871616 RepID=UPI002FDA58F7
MFNRVSGPSALGRDAFAVPRPHTGEFGELVYDSLCYRALDGWRPLFMDVRVPVDPRLDGLSPLVLWVHGGSWVHGSRRRRPVDIERHWMIERLLLAGYAVASIDYRLASEAPFPGPASDVRAALAYVGAHAEDLGVDRSRLVVWGESAGAHLGLLTGVPSARFAELGGAADHPAEPMPTPAAIVDWYGPADLHRLRAAQEAAAASGVPGAEKELATFERFLSMGWGVDAASPELALDEHCPPVFLAHGAEDSLVPIGESRYLAQRLQELGVAHELTEFPGGHVFANSKSMGPAIEQTLDFLRATVADPFAGVPNDEKGDLDPVDDGTPLDRKQVARERREYRREVARVWGERTLHGETPIHAVTTTDLSLDGPDGPIRARLHEPDYVPVGGERELPLIIEFHSGGLVVGDLDTHGPSSARLAARAHAPVLQVDYRLTPEHKFPAAFVDAAAATVAAWEGRADLGLRPGREISRLVLFGDSAGAGLALSVGIELRSRREIPVDRIVALYPVLDWQSIPLWPGMSQYLGAETQEQIDPSDPRLRDVRLAPGAALELQGLPPVHLVVGTRDRVLDDCLSFAYRLRAAGNDLELQVLPGVPHGFNVLSADSELFAAAAAKVDGRLSARLWEK